MLVTFTGRGHWDICVPAADRSYAVVTHTIRFKDGSGWQVWNLLTAQLEAVHTSFLDALDAVTGGQFELVDTH